MLGFWAYAIDHVNVVGAIVHRTVGENSSHAHLLTHLLFVFATFLVALAALIRTWGAAYLDSSVVHDAKLHTGVLLADGPYRHVRHPLYFAGFLLAPAVALMASRLGFVIIVVGLTLLHIRLAGREDAELAKQHGSVFEEFRRRVPRLWPSIAPRVPSGGAKPRWGQAFRGEAFMWAFAIAMATFAVALNPKPMGIVMGVAMLAFLQQQFVHNRNKRRRMAGAA